jgi:hypothetical protein
MSAAGIAQTRVMPVSGTGGIANDKGSDYWNHNSCTGVVLLLHASPGDQSRDKP